MSFAALSFAALSFAARWLLRSVVVSSIGLSSIGAVACAVACAAAPPGPRMVMLPLAVRHARDLFTVLGPALNKTLGGTAQLAVLYALAFALGIVL